MKPEPTIVTWSDLYELHEVLNRDALAICEAAVRPIVDRYNEQMAPAVVIMNKYMMYANPRDESETANSARKEFDAINREARAALQEAGPHRQRCSRVLDKNGRDFKRAERLLMAQYKTIVKTRRPYIRRLGCFVGGSS